MFVFRMYRNFFPLPSHYTYAVVQLNEPLELIMAIGFWQFFLDRRRAYQTAKAERAATTSAKTPAKTRPV
jgi:hypothetical protein